MLTVVPGPVSGGPDGASGPSPVSSTEPVSLLDELVREGARRMLAAALEAEVSAYIDAHAGEVDEHGRRLVVRNGRHAPRQLLTGAGAVEVAAPRVNDKRVDEATGERKRFSSAILPPWCRKSPKVAEVLPLLYLHGLSGNDFTPALEQFLGTSAALSAATIARLTVQWQDEAQAFAARDLHGVDYVYVWADGVHVNVRLESERLCLLVLIGVRTDGTKELIALSDGYRESEGSWADLPKSAHPGAKKALAEIWNAEDREHAQAAVKAFAALYSTMLWYHGAAGAGWRGSSLHAAWRSSVWTPRWLGRSSPR